MPSLSEAKRRHARYYTQVAQQNRSNFNHLNLEMPNILLAGDFYINVEDWQNLPDLTQALNDYWLKRAFWDQYVRFNSTLLKNDAPVEGVKKEEFTKQLARLEEIRGNYKEARSLYKEIAPKSELYEDLDLTLDVLGHASRLAQIQGDDEEAFAYLERSLAVVRYNGMPKEEVDILLDMAGLYRKLKQYDRAHSIYNECFQMAESIGYASRTIDILAMQADLYFLEQHLQEAWNFGQVALTKALSVGNQVTVASIREHLAKVGAAMNKRIFISYNHQDRGFAERLATDLRNTGLAVWWAEGEIKVGDSITQKVSDGISRSAYLVVILSPFSITSPWVQRELSSALMRQLSIERGIVILPVLLTDCEIPVLLGDLKYADFRQDYGIGLQDLLNVFITN